MNKDVFKKPKDDVLGVKHGEAFKIRLLDRGGNNSAMNESHNPVHYN